jgi:hypothetical protein
VLACCKCKDRTGFHETLFPLLSGARAVVRWAISIIIADETEGSRGAVTGAIYIKAIWAPSSNIEDASILARTVGARADDHDNGVIQGATLEEYGVTAGLVQATRVRTRDSLAGVDCTGIVIVEGCVNIGIGWRSTDEMGGECESGTDDRLETHDVACFKTSYDLCGLEVLKSLRSKKGWFCLMYNSIAPIYRREECRLPVVLMMLKHGVKRDAESLSGNATVLRRGQALLTYVLTPDFSAGTLLRAASVLIGSCLLKPSWLQIFLSRLRVFLVRFSGTPCVEGAECGRTYLLQNMTVKEKYKIDWDALLATAW